MKGLRAMGCPLPKAQIVEMRDEINRSMFSLIKEDYLQAGIFLKIDPNNASMLKQQQVLSETLNRLGNDRRRLVVNIFRLDKSWQNNLIRMLP